MLAVRTLGRVRARDRPITLALVASDLACDGFFSPIFFGGTNHGTNPARTVSEISVSTIRLF